MSAGYTLAKPVHPGGYVRRKILEPRNLSITGAAHILGTPRQALSDVVSEKSSLSADMALKIEAVFGISIEMLMEMQTRFDIAAARKRQLAQQLRSPGRAESVMDRGVHKGRQRLTAA